MLYLMFCTSIKNNISTRMRNALFISFIIIAQLFQTDAIIASR
jgi:hypothetical protein